MIQQNPSFILLKRLWHIGSVSFWLGLWIFGLGLLFCYFIRYWKGDIFFPVRLSNYLMPWMLAALVPGLIAAGLANHKWLAVTLLAPAIFICFTHAPLLLSCLRPEHDDLTQLKVMSYNVWRENKNMSAAAEVIRKEQPDILLLQELQLARVENLFGALVDLYPDSKLHFAYHKKMLQAVISRYPLTQMDALPEKGQAQKVLIETPHGPITVFNIHPSKRKNWLQRHRQISALLAEDIATIVGPIILGGDFNTTDQTQTYWLVTQFLHNAHWEAGCGFGFTYPASKKIFKLGVPIPPLVRIDHIFYSNSFVPKRARTLKESGGSDHLPVVAEFFWRKM